MGVDDEDLADPFRGRSPSGGLVVGPRRGDVFQGEDIDRLLVQDQLHKCSERGLFVVRVGQQDQGVGGIIGPAYS